MRESFNNSRDTFSTYIELINLPALLFDDGVTCSKETSFEILQGEYGITNASASHPILISSQAESCTLVSLYNTNTKVGALTHIDVWTDLEDLDVLVNHVRHNNSEEIVVHMAGGISETFYMVADISTQLTRQPNIQILGWLDARNTTGSLALDTRNGHVTDKVGSDLADEGPFLTERYERISASIAAGSIKGPKIRNLLCSYHYTEGRETVKAPPPGWSCVIA